MVYVNTILESLVEACKQSDALPEAVTYSTVEFDRGGIHSDVPLPVIEFVAEDVNRDESRNTEFIGYEYDDNGDPIGYAHTAWFTADVHAYVRAVDEGQHTHRGLESSLRDLLSMYDTGAAVYYRKALPNPDDPSYPLGDVNWMRVHGWDRNMDAGLSPTMRTRDVTIEVAFEHTVFTSDHGTTVDTVEDVQFDIDVVLSDGSTDDAASGTVS